MVLDARRAERELVRVRVEAEAKERKRLKELALEKEARERVEREEERVRAARERTRVLEVERVKREERERKEREAVEEVRRQKELAAKEGSSMGGGGVEGGRLADGVSPSLSLSHSLRFCSLKEVWTDLFVVACPLSNISG